jgi:hypothetical protein
VRKEEEEVVPRERSTVVVLVVVQMVLLPRSPQRICGMQLGGGVNGAFIGLGLSFFFFT